MTACKQQTTGMVDTPLTAIVTNGMAGVQFGNWKLLFEGISTQGIVGGPLGEIALAARGRAGDSQNILNDLRVRQSWKDQVNAVSVNNYTFKLKDQGARIEFADHTYEAKDVPKTLIIAKNGSTRETW